MEALAIDFDGVLHDHKHPIEGRKMGPPMEGAKEAMELLSLKYKLIIHSVRAITPSVIENWMKYWEIPYHEITNIKPTATFYIDDRALLFKDWKSTIELLG
jgi:hypothetical protein